MSLLSLSEVAGLKTLILLAFTPFSALAKQLVSG
jgi:hypothetical protein